MDRNEIPALGAHTWCRYTGSGGVYVLDPIMEYFGRLPRPGAGPWLYHRPEDFPSEAP